MTQQAHSKLLDDLLVALGARPKLGKYWKQLTGVARQMRSEALIRYGLPGIGDASGILANGKGTRVEIEVKVGKDKQSKEQLNFERVLTSYQGVYILARSIPETIDKLEALCKT